MNEIRCAVIGTGTFAEVCHIPELQSHPRARVVAVCGRDHERARALADRFGVPDVHTDYRELCERQDIDAVTIVTRNADHHAQAIAAFDGGKHVFCEKPLAMNPAEAREMTARAHASGKVHQVAFVFRYNYGMAELRRRIALGEIGQPFYARIQYDGWYGLAPDWNGGWRTRKEHAGAGVMFELGSHLFDIVRHVLGPIESAFGFTHRVPRTLRDAATGEAWPIETDDLFNAWLNLVNGVRAQIFVSRVTPSFTQNGYLEVIGSKGALKASLSRGGVDYLKSSTPAAPDWVDLTLPPEASDKAPHSLGFMMRSFVDACIRGRIDPNRDASFDDGLAAQEAMAAVLTAEERGRVIRLDEVS